MASDLESLRSISRGDSSGFADILRRYQASVYQYLLITHARDYRLVKKFDDIFLGIISAARKRFVRKNFQVWFFKRVLAASTRSSVHTNDSDLEIEKKLAEISLSARELVFFKHQLNLPWEQIAGILQTTPEGATAQYKNALLQMRPKARAQRPPEGLCARVDQDLVAYLYKELPDEQKQEYQLHIGACAFCLPRVRAFQDLLIEMDELPLTQPPESVLKDLADEAGKRIKKESPALLKYLPYGIAALLAVSAGGYFALRPTAKKTAPPTARLQPEVASSTNPVGKTPEAQGKQAVTLPEASGSGDLKNPGIPESGTPAVAPRPDGALEAKAPAPLVRDQIIPLADRGLSNQADSDTPHDAPLASRIGDPVQRTPTGKLPRSEIASVPGLEDAPQAAKQAPLLAGASADAPDKKIVGANSGSAEAEATGLRRREFFANFAASLKAGKKAGAQAPQLPGPSAKGDEEKGLPALACRNEEETTPPPVSASSRPEPFLQKISDWLLTWITPRAPPPSPSAGGAVLATDYQNAPAPSGAPALFIPGAVNPIVPSAVPAETGGAAALQSPNQSPSIITADRQARNFARQEASASLWRQPASGYASRLWVYRQVPANSEEPAAYREAEEKDEEAEITHENEVASGRVGKARQKPQACFIER